VFLQDFSLADGLALLARTEPAIRLTSKTAFDTSCRLNQFDFLQFDSCCVCAVLLGWVIRHDGALDGTDVFD
jgi:hypothetical protein